MIITKIIPRKAKPKPKKKKAPVNRDKNILDRIYIWKGFFNTGFVWAEFLGVSFRTFARRTRQYGINDERTYYTRAEMKEYVHSERVHSGRIGGKIAKINNARRKKAPKLCTPLTIDELVKDKQFAQKAFNLIADLIKDAKTNITKKKNISRSSYYDESKSWLKNGNGGLEDLLKFTPLDVKKALRELGEYADKH